MPILACGTVVPPLDSSAFALRSWCVTAETYDGQTDVWATS